MGYLPSELSAWVPAAASSQVKVLHERSFRSCMLPTDAHAFTCAMTMMHVYCTGKSEMVGGSRACTDRSLECRQTTRRAAIPNSQEKVGMDLVCPFVDFAWSWLSVKPLCLQN